jgi:hypothetical protein
MSTSDMFPIALMVAITVGGILIGYRASPVSAFHLRKRDRRRDVRQQTHDRRDQANLQWGEIALWIHEIMWILVAVMLVLDFAITFGPAMGWR